MKRVGECVCRARAGSSLPRAESEPPITVIVGRDRLDARRSLGEQRDVGGRRGVGAVGGELRRPEEVGVRLVADRDGAHLRQRARDRGGEGGELRARAPAVSGVSRAEASRPRRSGGCRRSAAAATAPRSAASSGAAAGQRRRPDRAEHDRAEAGVAHQRRLRRRRRRTSPRPRPRRRRAARLRGRSRRAPADRRAPQPASSSTSSAAAK